MLTSETRLRPNTPDVAAKVMDGEAIIMNLANGHYYSLEGVGAQVWQMIQGGLTLSQVAERLVDRYGVGEAEVRPDLTNLVGELLDEGLVRVEHGGASSPTELEGGPSSYSAPVLVKYTDMAELLALDPPMPGLGVGA